MRKTVFLCVLIIALLTMTTLAYAAETDVVIYGQKYIDGLPADKPTEGLFSFELLYDDMTPFFDEFGMPVQAVNGPDGSFVLKAQIDAGRGQLLYVREIDDFALSQTYTMDTAAHPVTVEPDGNGGVTVSPDPVIINNLLRSIMVTVYVEWRGASKPPASITLDVYRNGRYLLARTETPLSDGSIDLLLPEFDQNGVECVYSFIERPISGYITEYSNPVPYQSETGKAYDGGIIINTDRFLPPETSASFPLVPLIVLNILSGLSIAALVLRRRGAAL